MTHAFNMVVSKKGTDGKYVEVGKVAVPFWTLADLDTGIDATSTDTDGFPVYTNPKHQALFVALLSSIKAAARNKLQPSSVSLKPGCTIAATLAEFLEKGERGGGEALALHREFIAAFNKYLAEKSGKKEAVQAIYSSLVRTKSSIPLASEARKEGLLAQLAAF